MKNILALLVAGFSFLYSYAQLVAKVIDPVEWVNPLMGSDSKPSLSNGNTYPSICVPWGMNFWSPQTGAMGDGWMYQYSVLQKIQSKINMYKVFSLTENHGIKTGCPNLNCRKEEV